MKRLFNRVYCLFDWHEYFTSAVLGDRIVLVCKVCGKHREILTNVQLPNKWLEP